MEGAEVIVFSNFRSMLEQLFLLENAGDTLMD